MASCLQLSATLSGCCPRLDDVCENRSKLAFLAENKWFIAGAYICVFLPWAILHNYDFITEKWRSVKETRRLGWMHLGFSIGPIGYVAFYAFVMHENKDYTEMMAAIVTMFYNGFNVLRTFAGLVQLRAFKDWCLEAAECMKAISGRYSFDMEYFEDKLKVNNTIIDNELYGTDLEVYLSPERLLKNWRFNPSKWVTTRVPRLCTLRWTGAYLCGLGEDWRGRNIGTVNWKMSFEDVTHEVRSCLTDVTFLLPDSLFSLRDSLFDSKFDVSNWDSFAAYGSEIFNCTINPFEGVLQEIFVSHSAAFDNLTSSYPSKPTHLLGLRRYGVRLEHAESVALAKQIGCKTLVQIRECSEKVSFPTRKSRRRAWKLLLQQWDQLPSTDIDFENSFEDIDWIPVFPWRMPLIPLWDKLTNWRVPQAAAHKDIHAALELGKHCFYHAEIVHDDVFETFRRKASELSTAAPKYRSFGVVLDFVRTRLAEFKFKNPSTTIDWEPELRAEPFSFSLSRTLKKVQQFGVNSDVFRYSSHLLSSEWSYVHRRLIWECQFALQEELVQNATNNETSSGNPTATNDATLSGNRVLIMLFILSMPAIRIQLIPEQPSTAGVSSTDVSSTDTRVELTEGHWRVTPFFSSVSIMIAIDYTSGKASLHLEGVGVPSPTVGEGATLFKWKDWINACMGFMKGIDEACAARKRYEIDAISYERSVENVVDLSKEIIQLRIDSGRTMPVWPGWSVFDVNVCQFEVEKYFESQHSSDFDERVDEAIKALESYRQET